ncbi:MAG: hypothetical protein PHE78_08620 [Candidatus Gastranaerophilales bacterium]|nr:hypothetical protein [Candidatus Gastranaerophilales bacterium]
MRVILSDATSLAQYILPVMYNNQPSIKNSANNEVYNTINGPVKIPGQRNFTEISIQSIFPVDKNYEFIVFGSHSNGWDYVDWLDSQKDRKKPIRAIVINGFKKTVVNKLFTVDSFEYSVKGNGDIAYTLELSEFNGEFWKSLKDAWNARKING